MKRILFMNNRLIVSTFVSEAGSGPRDTRRALRFLQWSNASTTISRLSFSGQPASNLQSLPPSAHACLQAAGCRVSMQLLTYFPVVETSCCLREEMNLFSHRGFAAGLHISSTRSEQRFPRCCVVSMTGAMRLAEQTIREWILSGLGRAMPFSRTIRRLTGARIAIPSPVS